MSDHLNLVGKQLQPRLADRKEGLEIPERPEFSTHGFVADERYAWKTQSCHILEIFSVCRDSVCGYGDPGPFGPHTGCHERHTSGRSVKSGPSVCLVSHNTGISPNLDNCPLDSQILSALKTCCPWAPGSNMMANIGRAAKMLSLVN